MLAGAIFAVLKRPLMCLALIALVSACGQFNATETHRVGGKSARDVFSSAQVAALAENACAGNASEVVRLAHDGVDPNSTGIEGVTPLLWAANCENMRGMTALLDVGADPNLEISGLGMSAIVVAAGMDNPDVLELLLRRGGDANAVLSDSNQTALTVALDAGLDGKGWERYYALLRAGADINRRYEGHTIAEYAAAMNQYDKVVELLRAGYRDNLPWLGRLVTAADVATMDPAQRPYVREAQSLLEQRGIRFPVPPPGRAPL